MLLDFSSAAPSFCQYLPLESLIFVRFYLGNPSFLILSQESLVYVRFYFWDPQFLSGFTSGAPSFFQILTPGPPSS